MVVLLCENPFDLTKEQTELECHPGESIRELLARYKRNEGYIVVHNGGPLELEEGLQFRPEPGDDVMLVVELHNPALRTIAMIGVQVAGAFLAPGLGNFIGGVLFTSLTTVAQNAIAGALISVAGALAVGGIASLFQKTPGGQNYGVLGPSTTGRSGVPIPKGYGLMRSGGNVVESWIDIMGNNGDQHDVDDGADTIGRQYINGRVDFGWGPASSMPNILLNGKDINEFSDVSYFIRLGTNTQGAVYAYDPGWIQKNITTTGSTQNLNPTTNFTSINNNYPINQRVRCGITQNFIVVPGQRDDTEKLTVFVTFPQGVWRLDNNNVIKRCAIDYDVYYRDVLNNGSWIKVPPTSNDYTGSSHYYYNIRQTLLRQATIIDGLPPSRYDVKVVKYGAGAVHNPLDYFEHESNQWGDELWIESVQETSYTTLMYKNTIQLCFRIMATDQISGSDLQFQADIVHELHTALPEELASYSHDTPACVTYDMLADPLYGANWTNIDLDFFERWADLTNAQVDDGDGGTQKLAVFNGIFDQGVNVWQAVSSVAVMSRANLQRIGRNVTGWLDAPDVPVQLFTMGNIIKDSYEVTYLDLSDRLQEFQITFADAADDYKTRNPLRLVGAQNESSAEALKKQAISLLGCTNRVQAWYWGSLHLRQAEDILRTHTWKTNAQGIRSRVGNVVSLQHDVPGYAWGGVVMPGSTASTLIFDRKDQPFDANSAWTVTVQHPAVKRATAAITSPVGSQVTISGYGSAAKGMRLVQGDVDIAIAEVVGTTLTLENVDALAAGSVDIWEIDVLETVGVTGLQGTQASLATPLSIVPTPYSQFIYQSTTSKTMPVRIKQILKDPGKMHYTLTAVDYSDSQYDIPAPVGLEGV